MEWGAVGWGGCRNTEEAEGSQAAFLEELVARITSKSHPGGEKRKKGILGIGIRKSKAGTCQVYSRSSTGAGTRIW